jgi:peptidoglycan/LPS O-acetylase OafA/YrhL
MPVTNPRTGDGPPFQPSKSLRRVVLRAGRDVSHHIVCCVAILGKKLSARLCLWLGDISYSLYLIHMPVLLALVYLFYEKVPLGPMIALTLPAMLVAAQLMHHLIELPSMALGRRLAQRRE